MNHEYMEMMAWRSREIRDVFNLPRYENLETFADEMLDVEEKRLKEGKVIQGHDHTYENVPILEHKDDNTAGSEAVNDEMEASPQEVSGSNEKDGELESCGEKEKRVDQNRYNEEEAQGRGELKAEQEKMLNAEEKRLKEGKGSKGHDHTYENVPILAHNDDNPAGSDAVYEELDAPLQEGPGSNEKDGEGEFCVEEEERVDQERYDEEEVQGRGELKAEQEKNKKW